MNELESAVKKTLDYQPQTITEVVETTPVELLTGQFNEATAAPTLAPRSFASSIVKDSGANRIYYWDETNKQWRSTQLTYAGYIGSDGSTDNNLPSGWTVNYNGAGDYTLIHGLSTTNYAIVFTATTKCVITILTQGSSSVNYQTNDLTAGNPPNDHAVFFILARVV